MVFVVFAGLRPLVQYEHVLVDAHHLQRIVLLEVGCKVNGRVGIVVCEEPGIPLKVLLVIEELPDSVELVRVAKAGDLIDLLVEDVQAVVSRI